MVYTGCRQLQQRDLRYHFIATLNKLSPKLPHLPANHLPMIGSDDQSVSLVTFVYLVTVVASVTCVILVTFVAPVSLVTFVTFVASV